MNILGTLLLKHSNESELDTSHYQFSTQDMPVGCFPQTSLHANGKLRGIWPPSYVLLPRFVMMLNQARLIISRLSSQPKGRWEGGARQDFP